MFSCSYNHYFRSHGKNRTKRTARQFGQKLVLPCHVVFDTRRLRHHQLDDHIHDADSVFVGRVNLVRAKYRTHRVCIKALKENSQDSSSNGVLLLFSGSELGLALAVDVLEPNPGGKDQSRSNSHSHSYRRRVNSFTQYESRTHCANYCGSSIEIETCS